LIFHLYLDSYIVELIFTIFLVDYVGKFWYATATLLVMAAGLIFCSRVFVKLLEHFLVLEIFQTLGKKLTLKVTLTILMSWQAVCNLPDEGLLNYFPMVCYLMNIFDLLFFKIILLFRPPRVRAPFILALLGLLMILMCKIVGEMKLLLLLMFWRS